MFLQASVILSTRGVACMAQGCVWQGVHGRGGVCGQGACMGEGVWQGDMHGRGACMVGACVARGQGHVWWGGMHGRGCGKGACVVKGVCMAKGVCMVKGGCAWWGGGMHGEEGMHGEGGHVWYACPPPRDAAGQCAGGTHPTGMHSCFWYFLICST